MLLLELADSCWTAAVPLAAGEPPMDAFMATRIFSRALHILFAIVLGGGVFYIRSVLADGGADAAFGARRQVWARWVMVASALLIVTGLFNYVASIRAAKAPGAVPLPQTYHMLFGVKFLLGLLVMFLAALVAGKTASADKARGNLRRWMSVAWTSVMAIVIIGAMMRMMHEPRPNAAAA
ncbi:MAG TPA: hypothetical protein VEQ85_13895, partial [Lacipirellulaceae bacterium]|nr:hypothetical protein [Lacipirellulaceae bacterium]